MGPGLIGEMRDAMPRLVHAQQGDEIGLAAGGVLVGRLAQDVLVALDIQQVVDDLVGQADVMGEADQGLTVNLPGAGDDQGNLEGIGEQGPGLEPLHPGHAAEVVADAQQVDHLATGHAARATGKRQAGGQFAAHGGVIVGVLVQQDVKGGGLQGVAGEDGGGLVIGPVHGRTAAADVVVVHTGQVVMDQAVGMDAFQGTGGAQHRPLLDVEQIGGLEGEEGTQPLAGAKGGIAHGLGQARFRAIGAGQEFIQGNSDQVGDLGHPVDHALFRRVGGEDPVQNSLPPRATSRSTPIRTTSPAASGKPRVRTSDMKGPIWRGGKLTTAATLRPSSWSRV